MSTLLSTWLDDHRAELLPRWRSLLDAEIQHANGNGATSHPNEDDVLLSSIYDGLITAAQGDFAPLEECLRLVRALRTTPGEDELCERLTLTFQLRRAAWDVIFANGILDDDTRDLINALEKLVERTALMLTSYWTASANAVAQQLQQAEMLATSLAETTEQSDRIALQMSNLHDIASHLASSLDPSVLLDVVQTRLAEALEVEHVGIWLRGSNDQLHLMDAPTDGCTMGDSTTDMVQRAYYYGQTLLNLTPTPEEQGSWYHAGCGVLAVPMMLHDTVTGVVVVQDPAPAERLGRQQENFVQSVVSQLAVALENARLYDEVRGFNTVLEQRIAERTRELRNEHAMMETLNQIALEVSSTLDLDLLLQSCLQLLADLVVVQHGSIMLIEPDTGHLVDRAVLGRNGMTGFTRFPMGQGVVGWVAQHRKPALIKDVSEDSRWLPLPDDGLEHKLHGSMIAVPLVVQHDVSGVMLLSHNQVHYFTDDHLRLLNASAGPIALGIHNAMLYDQIQQQLMRQGEMLRTERRTTTQSTAILQSLSDGVIVCDIEGAVLTANPAAERILDRQVEELLTWRLPELLSRMFAARSREIPVEHLLAYPQDAHGVPRNYTGDFQIGTTTVRLTLDPVITTKNEVMGAVAVFRDITREVESDRLKDEFIGTVSHELRTPMTSIKGFTQLLAMGSLGPINDTQKEFLSTIHTNAERMILIINDLLDITKIEAGSIELDLRPLHLAEALGNVVMESQTQIHTRSQELTINIPPGLPLVQADARRFNQILLNLLSNAVKYTPSGGKITIEAHEISHEQIPEAYCEGIKRGRYVQVDICDTGVGIAPEEQELVFKRFYRTENPLKVEAGGTGLGLSLVRPLVRLFGGRIWLQSALNEGTTVSLVVPVA